MEIAELIVVDAGMIGLVIGGRLLPFGLQSGDWECTHVTRGSGSAQASAPWGNWLPRRADIENFDNSTRE